MPKRIIIIDNDDDILQIINYVLTESGYSVSTANDIVSFNRIADIGPDLLLVDDWVADGYGSQLCLQLKNDPKTRDIPMILISANNNIEQAALSYGADDYISKPFDVDALIAKVRSWAS